jgi:pimeloyl-ACP methyl ester carboxylesterase
MPMFDHGHGPPLIVIPGVQGRWEWMQPALVALQTRCRTIAYTLRGDEGSERSFDPSLGFDNYLQQLDEVFEKTGIERAAVCGVSYGGFIALRYAATRPERVSSIILTSAPAPGWSPSERQSRYIARPWLMAPAFVLRSPLRVWPEVARALPDWRTRLNFLIRHGLRVISAPMVPTRMAERVRLQQALDFRPDCDRVAAPALIVTGEEELDRVVPVHVTQTYQSLLPGARYEVMHNTGHIGMLTQPDRYAQIVGGFVHAHHH